MLKKIFSFINKNRYEEYWKILYKESYFINLDFNQSFEIKNTFRHWYADPFIFSYNGQILLFAEEYDRFLKKGNIVFFDLKAKKLKATKVLETGYHISYPFVFLFNNIVYMLIESSSISKVQIYKSTIFPLKWIKEKDILTNIEAVDSNLYKENDKLYLVTSILCGNSMLVRERIYELNNDFSINKLLLENLPSFKLSRNAGDFIYDSNSTFRFTQLNDKYNYGLGVLKSKFSLHENMIIDNYSYKNVFYKNNNHIGFHTISLKHGYLAIDIKYRKKNGIIKIIWYICLYLIKRT